MNEDAGNHGSARIQQSRMPLKRWILAAMALVTLAGCTKNEPTFTIISDPASPQATVFFDFDSVELRPASWSALEQFATARNSSKGGGRILVCGHSDMKGSAEAKLAVSQRRAEAVRDALVKLGFQRGEILVLAIRDKQLMVSAGASGQAANRRVEIELERPLGLGSRYCRMEFSNAGLLSKPDANSVGR